MIGYLSGKPQPFTSDSILLQVRGVGYQVYLSPQTKKLVLKQSPAKLYIYTHIRDDTLDLYGFTTQEALQLFKLIINISGIGPKIAINLLDKGVEAIGAAVANADVEFFTSLPRLGKKNAQKIIIELKPKLGDLKELDLAVDSPETSEVHQALINLGFSKKQARQALEKTADPSDTLEQKITKAIKYFGQGKK